MVSGDLLDILSIRHLWADALNNIGRPKTIIERFGKVGTFIGQKSPSICKTETSHSHVENRQGADVLEAVLLLI